MVFVEKLSHEAAALIQGEFDFMFVDGDHSLEGIQRDWADWSGRLARGAVVALHDTCVPAHNSRVTQLGSFCFFEENIRCDPRFEIIEQVDSLSVLRRLNGNASAP